MVLPQFHFDYNLLLSEVQVLLIMMEELNCCETLIVYDKIE